MSFRTYLNPTDPDAPCACSDCDWTGRAQDAAERGISGFSERVAPGETTPVGECPECGALAHLVEA